MKTITAISTPAGTGGIAVIRLSGPDAVAIADRAWRGRPLADARPNSALFGRFLAADGSTLDECVATVFRAPHSFTGEDTVELSVHGSPWIQREVLQRLIDLGAAPAGPGEFSQRAFMNGKMDLAQAEGVADLIAASSRAAHRLAMTQVSGSFSRRLDQLREQLVTLASLLELELDFSEEDVEFADRDRLRTLTDDAIREIVKIVNSYSTGRALKEGVPVVIAGEPNSGKSTLLNALLGEEKAIVSDIPGTTRDVIEDTVEIDGILFRLFDTAGLRDTADRVERIGIDRAQDQLQRASIILWTSTPHHQPSTPHHPLPTQLLLHTKCDLHAEKQSATHEGGASLMADEASDRMPELRISAKTGEGMEALKKAMVRAAKGEGRDDADIILTNLRHKTALEAGAAALKRVRAALTDGTYIDLIAQDLREALHHIGTVTGAITTPDLLTQIFTHFCIGK